MTIYEGRRSREGGERETESVNELDETQPTPRFLQLDNMARLSPPNITI